MSSAAAKARAPSRFDTMKSPTAAAPAITAWSEGKDQSVVRSMSTSAVGCAAYGRVSATRAATGWFTATASRVPSPAHIAASPPDTHEDQRREHDEAVLRVGHGRRMQPRRGAREVVDAQEQGGAEVEQVAHGTDPSDGRRRRPQGRCGTPTLPDDSEENLRDPTQTASRAWARSAQRSSTCSMPTESRNRLTGTCSGSEGWRRRRSSWDSTPPRL